MSEGDLEALGRTFDAKSRKMAGRLFWRDLREIVAGAFVVAVFSSAALRKGPKGWPLWVSSALVLGVTVFFILERFRSRRSRVGPGVPLLAKIESDLAELRHQHRLLMNVGTWYLGPIVLSWAIALADSGFHGMSGGLRTPLAMGAYAGSSLLLFWFIWKLNRRAARKNLEPKIAELEAMRDGLLSSPNP
jgi:membrane protein implicated in regulation of membrane protease activity